MNILKNRQFEKLFVCWLVTLIFLVIIMIVVGGLTRLTDSGLSITNWDLFRGVIPPMNNFEWESYFSLYKQIPQYRLLNYNITLSEFKYIYLWEYYHRLLGRVIGLFFLLPFVFFIIKKIFSKEYLFKFYIIFFFILLQGFIGWYMVKSGLVNNITVSHYRLALHLFFAFLILSQIFWYFRNIITQTNKKFFNKSNSFFSIKIFIFLIFLQIIIGAFVSGLDAGKVYQTWPLMNGSFYPSNILNESFVYLFSFKEHGFVQFIHRNLAYLIFFNIIFIGYKIFLEKAKYLYKLYALLFFIILLQIFLGIMTLVSGLNIIIASTHQISSIFLTIVSLSLYHRTIN